jgi:PAS domain S-box-containing protein
MTYTTNILRTLVVEDNEGDFLIIEELLAEEIKSPAVVRTESLKQTTEILKSNTAFDVLLLDLTLPDASGEKLIKTILNIAGQIPVIVLTGFTDKKFAIKTLSLGVSDYLQKDGLNAQQLSKSIEYSIERKKSIIQLKESEEKYRNLFHLSPLPMWVYDIETLYFLDVNRAAINHYGYTKEEFLSMTVVHIRPPENINILHNAINALLESEDKYFKGFTQHYNKRGELMEIEIQGNVIWYNNRKGILNLANDITEKLAVERKIKANEDALKALNSELEERVAQRTEELLEANKYLESYSYAVSHDLQAPLRSIMGFTQILRQKTKDNISEDCNTYLGHIVDAAKKMSELINNLLEFSKLSKKNINKKIIETTALVNLVWSHLQKDYPEKIKFTLNNLPNINGDTVMIEQVFVNLISNAVKYSSKKEQQIIEVGAKEKNNSIVFYVKDNGAGFDMTYYDKLFNIFKRLHAPADFDGTGVGLAIVKLVIEKHGGAIWAESEINQGATFYFSIPK